MEATTSSTIALGSGPADRDDSVVVWRVFAAAARVVVDAVVT